MRRIERKVVLIQIRQKQDILREERQSFIKACSLLPDQLIVVNPIFGDMDTRILGGVHAVIIGGSGGYSVTEEYEWTAKLSEFVEDVLERNLPLFGSCWGHQFLAKVLGGTVINDPTRSEMGTHEVKLTDQGVEDEVLGKMPRQFLAQMGHQDRVSQLPSGCVELATNDVAPYQAFRVIGKPVYGTQFHPELSAENERGRLEAYRKAYPKMAADNTFKAVYDSVQDTPEVSGLLNIFLDHFLEDDK